MSLALIAAVAANRVVGRENTLPWSLPEDLQHFKRLTLGHRVMMGRHTFLSLKKPLPGRQNVVISKQLDNVPEDVLVCHSIEEALNLPQWGEHSTVFCMGGAQLYQAMLPLAQTLYLTEIQRDVVGDAYFPLWNKDEWQQVSCQAGEQCPDGWKYDFITYKRM
ncbi:MAG: dihydrofolate reductase [Pseudomonadota bacterium]